MAGAGLDPVVLDEDVLALGADGEAAPAVLGRLEIALAHDHAAREVEDDVGRRADPSGHVEVAGEDVQAIDEEGGDRGQRERGRARGDPHLGDGRRVELGGGRGVDVEVLEGDVTRDNERSDDLLEDHDAELPERVDPEVAEGDVRAGRDRDQPLRRGAVRWRADDAARAATLNDEVAAVGDDDPLLVDTGEHADLRGAIEREGVEGRVDARVVAEAGVAVADGDRAAATLVGEGPEAAATRFDVGVERLGAPEHGGERAVEAARTVGGGASQEVPRDHAGRRRGAHGEHPVVAGDGERAEAELEAGADQGDRDVGPELEPRPVSAAVVARVPHPRVEVAGFHSGIEDEPARHGHELFWVVDRGHELHGARVVGLDDAGEHAATDVGADLVVRDLLAVRELGAPRQDLEHLADRGVVRVILRGRQEGDGDPVGADHRGDAVERRGVVEAPEEAVRLDALDADRLDLMARVTLLDRGFAQVAVVDDGRDDREAGAGAELV